MAQPRVALVRRRTPPPSLVDAHAHLDAYGAELPLALAEIRTHAIRTLAVSSDVPSYRKVEQVAAAEPYVVPAFGIHPWRAPQYVRRLNDIDTVLADAQILGEIGLDHRFVKDAAKHVAQDIVFERCLAHASRNGKCVNVHSCGAETQVLQMLRVHTPPSIIMHWYSGPLKLVEDFLALGAYFTVGVEVLLSKHICSLATVLPDERLLTETDNPGGWRWLTGMRGLPLLVERVLDSLAELRRTQRELLAAQIVTNLDRVLAAGGAPRTPRSPAP